MNTESLQTWSQVLIFAGAIFMAVGSFGHYYFGKLIDKQKEFVAQTEKKEEAKQNAYEGKLEPEPKVLLSTKSNIIPKLQIGNGGAIFMPGSQQSGLVLGFLNYSDLTIFTEDRQVKVSLILRNKAGEIVAQLVANEWKINKENVWDRNYSQDALEVKDGTGNIVLQVRALPDRVQLQASVYDTTGRNLTIVEGPSGDGAMVTMSPPGKPKSDLKIKPMFKYPSRQHLGEVLNVGS